MAEVLGTVVAGAQAIDYCIQIYDVFRKIYSATKNQKKYEATTSQLICILQEIQESEDLRTPVITQCTRDVLEKLKDVHTTLTRPGRNEWKASVAFAFRQKRYDQLFAHLDQKRSIMELHIAQINTNALGRITATLVPMNEKLGCILQQSSQREATESLNQAVPSLPDEPLARGQREESDELNMDAPQIDSSDEVYRSPGTTQLSSGHPSPRLKTETLAEAPHQTVNSEGESRSYDKIDEEQCRSWLERNIQRANASQILGLDIRSGSTVADADILRITSNFRICNNIHIGNGDQVIGQRVRAGAKACRFSGSYSNNEHHGNGMQIIGLLLD